MDFLRNKLPSLPGMTHQPTWAGRPDSPSPSFRLPRSYADNLPSDVIEGIVKFVPIIGCGKSVYCVRPHCQQIGMADIMRNENAILKHLYWTEVRIIRGCLAARYTLFKHQARAIGNCAQQLSTFFFAIIFHPLVLIPRPCQEATNKHANKWPNVNPNTFRVSQKGRPVHNPQIVLPNFNKAQRPGPRLVTL
jgi:hypothetical protein